MKVNPPSLPHHEVDGLVTCGLPVFDSTLRPPQL